MPSIETTYFAGGSRAVLIRRHRYVNEVGSILQWSGPSAAEQREVGGVAWIDHALVLYLGGVMDYQLGIP